jgi:hypothetical protein
MAREWVDAAPEARETVPAWLAWWGGLCALVVGQLAAIMVALYLIGKALRLWWPVVPPLGGGAVFGLACGVLMVFYALTAFDRIVRTGDE